MPENELQETRPTTIKKASTISGKKKFPIWMIALVTLILLLVSVIAGYSSGLSRRYIAERTLVSSQLQEQYNLGMEADAAGQYEVARQHFEFVLQKDPNFPGIRKAYADLLVHLLVTPTITPTLTPSATSTPDPRSAQEILKNVSSLLSAPAADLCARDWNMIIAALDSLRKADSKYQTASVDGMYYISLRNRGVCKIYPQAYQPNNSCDNLNINLEGGIYDLTQAEHFGPLDNEAAALRTWARTYIAGASFWDQDWQQVKDYFALVMANTPQLADSSCTSATERWREASIGYALYLMDKGDYCGAEEQFNDAFSINVPRNSEYYPTATEVSDICNGDAEPPKTPTP